MRDGHAAGNAGIICNEGDFDGTHEYKSIKSFALHFRRTHINNGYGYPYEVEGCFAVYKTPAGLAHHRAGMHDIHNVACSRGCSTIVKRDRSLTHHEKHTCILRTTEGVASLLKAFCSLGDSEEKFDGEVVAQTHQQGRGGSSDGPGASYAVYRWTVSESRVFDGEHIGHLTVSKLGVLTNQRNKVYQP